MSLATLEPAATSWRAMRSFSTLSEYSAVPALYFKPLACSSFLASSAVLPTRSGTSISCEPCETVRLMVDPFAFFALAAGSWLITLPESTLSE